MNFTTSRYFCGLGTRRVYPPLLSCGEGGIPLRRPAAPGQRHGAREGKARLTPVVLIVQPVPVVPHPQRRGVPLTEPDPELGTDRVHLLTGEPGAQPVDHRHAEAAQALLETPQRLRDLDRRHPWAPVPKELPTVSTLAICIGN